MTDLVNAVTVEVSPQVEIKNPNDFALYAQILGVEVGQRGRKPFGKLLAAIDGDDRFTFVETEYFNRKSAATTNTGSNGYGDALKVLRDIREAAIKAAHDDYDAARKALRVELGMPADSDATAKPATGNAYVVSARIPQRAKDGTVKRNAKGDKVLFAPKPSVVTVTNAEIRELVPDTGTRGRLSAAQTLYAAVVKGDWLPRELLATDKWETVLLTDTKVESTTIEPVAVAS